MYRNDPFFRRIATSSAYNELLKFIRGLAGDELSTLNTAAVGALMSGETAKAQAQLGRWLLARDLMEYIESFIGAKENGR